MSERARESEGFRVDPLHGRLLGRLREMIINGELVAGEPVAEMELCERFGVSRTPVREALKVLAAEGLVDLLPRRGAVVSHVHARDIVEKFEVVRLIESHAVGWICAHAPDAVLRSLREKHNALVQSHQAGDAVAYFNANEQFHRGLVEATGNQSLVDIHNGLVVHLRRARFQGMDRVHPGDQFLNEHERIITKIEARDGRSAVRAIQKHQNNVESDATAMLRNKDVWEE